MFHYPSSLLILWGLWTAAVAAERRDPLQLAANRREIATRRTLSQSVVIGRKKTCGHAMRKEKLNFTVPTTARHFLY